MNNNYELGKVIVALNINITSKDVLDYYIDLVLDGIDYEKAEIIFHSKNTESLNEGTNIVLIYLKDKNPHAVTNAVAKLSSSPYIVYAESQMILYTISFGEFKKSMHRLHGIIQLVIVVSVLE